MLSVASIEIIVLSMASIETGVVCDEYKYLVLSVASLEIFVRSVMSTESSIFCYKYRILCCL